MADKEVFMEALGNLAQKKKDARKLGAVNLGQDIGSRNLAKGMLDQDVMIAKGSELGADVTPAISRIAGGTDKIDTKQVAKTTDIGDFAKKQKDLDLKQRLKSSFKAAADAGDDDMMNKLRKVASKFGKQASKGLKALPIVGGAASLMMSPEDASAALPILDSADSVGMSAADENQMLAETQSKIDYGSSQAHKDKLARLAALKGRV